MIGRGPEILFLSERSRMKRLSRLIARFCSRIVAWWNALWFAVPHVQRWNPAVGRKEDLQKLLDEVRQETGMPGVTVALVHGDLIVSAASGELVLGEGSELRTDHRLHIGSVTKGFTALLIAHMLDRGELSLESTMGELLPEMDLHPNFRLVTIHQLLVNQAGLIGYHNSEAETVEDLAFLEKELPKMNLSPGEERESIARYFLNRAPFYEPGRRALYSNVGWSLLGFIAERMSGESFESLLRKRILQPLEMADVGIGGWPASTSDPEQPRGHYTEGNGYRPQPLDDPYRLQAWLNPAGGLHMTVQDLALYARDTLRGLRGEKALLAKRNYNLIHSVQLAVPVRELYPGMSSSATLRMGYGWALLETNRGTISAGEGSAGTFFASTMVFPYLNVAVVSITNCGDRKASVQLIKKLTGIRWG